MAPEDGNSIGPRILRVIIAIFAVAFPLMAAIYCSISPWSTLSAVIVKMCCLVIGLVLCLWILDASGSLQFSRPWMSKAIWVAAIAGILAGGVAVFKNQVAGTSAPLQGQWRIDIKWSMNHGKDKGSRQFEGVLAGAGVGGVYRGTSYVDTSPVADDHIEGNWIEIPKLSVEELTMRILYRSTSNATPLIDVVLDIKLDAPMDVVTHITGHAKTPAEDSYEIVLTRL